MAGISGKAIGRIENKFKYNKIEYDSTFGIDEYEAFYRNLDPQIGRWWQIDPKIENGQESLSPYQSMDDDPELKSDPLGDIPGPGPQVMQAAEDLVSIYRAIESGGSIKVGDVEKFISSLEPFGQGGLIKLPSNAATGGGIIVVNGMEAAIQGYNKINEKVSEEIKKLEKSAEKLLNKIEKANAKIQANETGSYTNHHESGKRYHGKGSEARAAQSGKRIAKLHNDPLVSTDHSKSKDDREAFKDESKRLENDGTHKSDNNYNQRDSPGTNYRKQDDSK